MKALWQEYYDTALAAGIGEMLAEEEANRKVNEAATAAQFFEPNSYDKLNNLDETEKSELNKWLDGLSGARL